MKKIEVICIGKLKFQGLQDLADHYLKKLKRFIDIKITVIKDPKLKNESENIKKEGKLISSQIRSGDFVIACDQTGREMDSLAFEKMLSKRISLLNTGKLVLLIGGYGGLSKDLEDKINQKISFSQMTFAHDLFRIILLEQIYRAFTISKNITYHR